MITLQYLVYIWNWTPHVLYDHGRDEADSFSASEITSSGETMNHSADRWAGWNQLMTPTRTNEWNNQWWENVQGRLLLVSLFFSLGESRDAETEVGVILTGWKKQKCQREQTCRLRPGTERQQISSSSKLQRRWIHPCSQRQTKVMLKEVCKVQISLKLWSWKKKKKITVQLFKKKKM